MQMRAPARATAEDVLVLIREIVDLKGRDFIYEPVATWRPEVKGWAHWPRYFDSSGKPDDIVGHVLVYRGFGPADVIEFVPVQDRAFPHQPWFRGFDPLARMLLLEAQRQQDLGSTFGYVLERTEWLYGEVVRLALGISIDIENAPGVQ